MAPTATPSPSGLANSGASRTEEKRTAATQMGSRSTYSSGWMDEIDEMITHPPTTLKVWGISWENDATGAGVGAGAG